MSSAEFCGGMEASVFRHIGVETLADGDIFEAEHLPIGHSDGARTWELECSGGKERVEVVDL